MSTSVGTTRSEDGVVRVKGWAMAGPCRRLLKDLGPRATFEQVKELLARAGIDLTRKCYDTHRRHIYPEAVASEEKERERKARGEPAQVPGPEEGRKVVAAVLDEAAAYLSQPRFHNTQSDHLRDFVRFSLAVEAVGGVYKARKLLDLIERVGGVLNGVRESKDKGEREISDE